jgi:glycogen debranching enzyme
MLQEKGVRLRKLFSSRSLSCFVILHVDIDLVDQKVFNEHTAGFMEATKFETEKDVNPGGYYKAIWARDAAFILKDQFLSGHFKSTLDRLLLIWSNQIGREVSPSLLFYSNFKRKPLLYGRGSPELDFKSIIANDEKISEFEGAIPTTIYYEKGFCEIYGQNPDIDSTALMIYITSWILNKLMTLEENNKDIDVNFRFIGDAKNDKEEKSLLLVVSTFEAINFLIPRMLRAITYLQSRDIDNDGLLEQKHNEDWMDTLLRTGKVVYSQACWILALKNLATLLRKLGNETESRRLEEISNRTISAVEEKMWSRNDNCYVDQLEADDHLDVEMHNRLVTQDISLYLVALTEREENRYPLFNDTQQTEVISLKAQFDNDNAERYERGLKTLYTLKDRIWKNNVPLVTEKEVTKTGPWRLKPNEYHNHTFWAWITGIEMIARNRFGKRDDFDYLLSLFVSNNGIKSNMLHEWVNPLSFKGNGAYPFRTGISAIRIAISESIMKTRHENI